MAYVKLIAIQMAKRMKFSVVGLPHYTVWHLYEPSVDDIRHMEEMAQEQKNRENEEKERAERLKKIKDEFKEPTNQWEKDKSEFEGIAQSEEEVRSGGSRAPYRPCSISTCPSDALLPLLSCTVGGFGQCGFNGMHMDGASEDQWE